MKRIQVLVDNKKSWIVPYALRLVDLLNQDGKKAQFIADSTEIVESDFLFLLGCEKVLGSSARAKAGLALVVHESNLPEGRGWSPVTWQILQGRTQFKMTLLEAVDEVDAGAIYIQDDLVFQGHELIDEIREIQGSKTIQIILRFLARPEDYAPRPQSGEPTFYPRRRPEDSKIDIYQSLEQQFNLLRVCDFDRYPAFFDHLGYRYRIKIEKDRHD